MGVPYKSTIYVLFFIFWTSTIASPHKLRHERNYDYNYGDINNDQDENTTTTAAQTQPTTVGALEKPESQPITGKRCNLDPIDPNLPVAIAKHIQGGAKLIKYDLTFPEYEESPLSIANVSNSYVYQANLWSRVVGEHGRTLLSLAFNYDVLSLKMLTFGVETLDVHIIDSPRYCFGKVSDSGKIHLIQELIVRDFNPKENEEIFLDEGEYVCNQVIENTDGYASFNYQCCSKVKSWKGSLNCEIEEKDKWINLMYTLIAILKVGFLLLGPLLLQKWIYNQSIRKTDYVAKLKETMRKTLLVHKVMVAENESTGFDERNRDFPGQFRKFKQLVKVIPADEVVPVNINRIHIQVNHRELMTEKTVPAGIFHFIWTNFLQCGLIKYEPFLTCCRESIIGSWDARFLFLKLLPSGSECNKACRQVISWAHVAYVIAGLILMGSVPVPYYIRLAIYYNYEEPEIEARKDAIENLGLSEELNLNVFHYLTPTHPLLITLYVCYFGSFLLLAFYQKFRKETFEDIVLGSLQDLRSISRLECFRLLLSHILLPLEKFGLCCGCLVGAIYWPLVLPLVLITIIWYCIPSLYLTGRFLIQGRPWCVRKARVPYVPKRKDGKKLQHPHLDVLSYGITSLENFMLLNNISPGPSAEDMIKTRLTARSCRREITKVFVGLLCVIWMFCILLVYAECFGFFIESFVLMLMGAIVNAGSAANYIMVGFWAVTYSVSCYNDAYEKYKSLNSKIFEYIKDKLTDDMKVLTVFREQKQRYTAFKYFSREELLKEREDEIQADIDSENELTLVTGAPSQIPPPSPDLYTDTIEYIDGKLHWKINNLIWFVDKKDTPRIPRRLFDMICEIEAPGCPGPVYRGLLKATQKFLYMVIFLLFVAVVVMAFGSMYQISSTNQLLVTLAGGFLPFVIRFVLDPRKGDIDLNTYTFQGKVHQIFKTYVQSWPVHDLTFTTDGNVEQDIQGSSQYHRDTPSHVDLLITIRDEDLNPGNIRSEAGSLPSLNSGALNRASPDDVMMGPNSSSTVAIPMVPLSSANTDSMQQHLLSKDESANPAYTARETGNNEMQKVDPSKAKVKDILRSVSKLKGQSSRVLSQEELDLVSNVDFVMDLSRKGNPEVRSISGVSARENLTDEDSEKFDDENVPKKD